MITIIDIDPAHPPCRFSLPPKSAKPVVEPDPPAEGITMEAVVRRFRGARRTVAVIGAGVSTAAAIPDFRSASGLFSGSKGYAVKDLFHVKSLSSPALLSSHHELITDLYHRASQAEPTPFHSMLATMDAEGRLLRCYTQNIDGLEERAGLRTGVPPPRKSAKGKGRARGGVNLKDALIAASSASMPASTTASGSNSASVSASATPSGTETPEVSSEMERGDSTEGGTPLSTTSLNAAPTHPPTPRCIPLHGQLNAMYCHLCSASVPIDDHLPLPPGPVACPTCDESSMIRSALSERQRRVGTLRASVVLYGEEHPEGDLIGGAVERDLRGTGRRDEREGRVDLLVVAGTSLAIPGVKRIVKEMAKALATRPASGVRDGAGPPIRTILVNDEPPAKPAEWEGVFDVWVRGDVQKFAALVADPSFAPPLPATPKRKASTPRKKTAVVNGLATPGPTPDKAAAAATATPTKQHTHTDDSPSTSTSTHTPTPTPTKRKPKRRRDDPETPTKKRAKTAPAALDFLPLTPRATPPQPREQQGHGEGHDTERDASPTPLPRENIVQSEAIESS